VPGPQPTLDPRPLALLAGLWCTLATFRLLVVDGPPPAPWTVSVAGDGPACARELRRLPGIGPRRAQAIVRHRWEHGRDFDLEEIRGIGPRTAAAVRAARAREP